MFKGIARIAPVNVKAMDGSGNLAQLQIDWYVYGDKSTTGSDLINITAYYKGSESAKVMLAKPCKVTTSALTVTEVGTPPPVDPPVDPPTDPASYEVIEMTRRSFDGMQTWTEYEYWGKRKLPL